MFRSAYKKHQNQVKNSKNILHDHGEKLWNISIKSNNKKILVFIYLFYIHPPPHNLGKGLGLFT